MQNKPPKLSLLKSPFPGSRESLSPGDAFPGQRQPNAGPEMNKAQLELAAAMAGAGLWSLELATNSFCINNTLREIFEIPYEMDITLEHFTDKVHPEDLPAVMNAIHRMSGGENNVRIEFRIVLSNGSIRWMHSRGGMYSCFEDGTSFLMGATGDITERKEKELELDRQRRFEALLSEISATFAKISIPEDVDINIEQSLKKILDYFGVDRCGLVRVDLQNLTFTPTHAAYRYECYKLPKDVNHASLFPWAVSQIRGGRCYHFSDFDELPPEAETDRRTWEAMGIKSILHMPLRFQNSISHMIIISSITRTITWQPEMLPRLQLIGEIFLNSIHRKAAYEELMHSYKEVARLKERLEVEADYLRAEVRCSRLHEEIIGQSEPLKRVLAMVDQVAPASSTVLISGETGTGKEMIANAIHEQSPRRDKLMVKVNCASLPSSLVESELFGREKGAYTGALTRQIGRFELADGSSIFLDEISELSLELQSKLLRALQDGEFERLGSPRTIKVDVRVIAATNRDLLSEVSKGRFRADLYYRLNVFPIDVPPLRERREDIPVLLWAFVREFNQKMGKRIHRIAKRDISLLQSYSWPGNIRELRNVVEAAMIVSSGEELKVTLPENTGSRPSPRLTLEEMERRYIEDILKQTGWRIKGVGAAADILGVNPSTLYSRIKKLGISSQQ